MNLTIFYGVCLGNVSDFFGGWFAMMSSLMQFEDQIRRKIWMETKKPATYAGFCDLAGVRTQDPILKRDVLYQLSYQVD